METSKRKFAVGLFCAGGFCFSLAHAATVLVSSDQQNANHPDVLSAQYFGKLVAQRSNGELTVVVKPDGELGGEMDTLQQVKDGQHAFARVGLASFSDLDPAASLASLPYLFRSTEHMWKVLNGPFGKRLDAELLQRGFVRIMFMDSGARDFYCNKPLRSQADFNGLRIRAIQSKVFETLITNLGAKSIPIAFNKVGDAFQAGKLDCSEGTIQAYVGSGLYKYAPYLMIDEHVVVPEIYVMSKKIWDTLPPAQQAIIRQAGIDSAEYTAKTWQEHEAVAVASLKKNGVTIVPKEQISMTAIEYQIIKTYNTYVTNQDDLQTITAIMTTKTAK